MKTKHILLATSLLTAFSLYAQSGRYSLEDVLRVMNDPTLTDSDRALLIHEHGVDIRSNFRWTAREIAGVPILENLSVGELARLQRLLQADPGTVGPTTKTVPPQIDTTAPEKHITPVPSQPDVVTDNVVVEDPNASKEPTTDNPVKPTPKKEKKDGEKEGADATNKPANLTLADVQAIIADKKLTDKDRIALVRAHGISFALDDKTVKDLKWSEVSGIQKLITAAKTSPDDVNQEGVPYKWFFSTGAVFQNPYRVDATTHMLEKSDVKTSEFLEFHYLNRFVLREIEEEDPHFAGAQDWTAAGTIEPLSCWSAPFTHFPDIDFKTGFVFGGDKATNYSASTIAGQGDFYSDASIGLPLLRYKSGRSDAGYVNKHQVSLDLAGGVVTDKNFLIAHPNFFAGLGYQVSFSSYNSDTQAKGFFIGRAGWAYQDLPKPLGANPYEVQFNNNYPKFEFRGDPMLSAYLAYPVVNDVYVTLGANVFLTRRLPSSWNITVGATIPLSSIAGIFKPISGRNDQYRPTATTVKTEKVETTDTDGDETKLFGLPRPKTKTTTTTTTTTTKKDRESARPKE